MSDHPPIPSVSVTCAQDGSSTRSNAHGMRPMQERAYQKRGEPHFLIGRTRRTSSSLPLRGPAFGPHPPSAIARSHPACGSPNLSGILKAKEKMTIIATIPFQHADLHAKDILGHDPQSTHSNSSSASLGGLCALAVQKSSSPNFAWVQHMLWNLSRQSASKTDLALNGSMGSNLFTGPPPIHQSPL